MFIKWTSTTVFKNVDKVVKIVSSLVKATIVPSTKTKSHEEETEETEKQETSYRTPIGTSGLNPWRLSLETP